MIHQKRYWMQVFRIKFHLNIIAWKDEQVFTRLVSLIKDGNKQELGNRSVEKRVLRSKGRLLHNKFCWRQEGFHCKEGLRLENKNIGQGTADQRACSDNKSEALWAVINKERINVSVGLPRNDAKVKPIFKHDNHIEVTNYRPNSRISLYILQSIWKNCATSAPRLSHTPQPSS